MGFPLSNRFRAATLLLPATLALLILAACGPSAEPLPPTREPASTFTATPEIVQPTVDVAAVETANAVAQAEAEAAAVDSAESDSPDASADDTSSADGEASNDAASDSEETTSEAVADTAEVAVNINLMNVRAGPGTGYTALGTANAGERFEVIGRNPAGDWWQINFRGQTGWVFNQLVTPANTGAVAVAQNIPLAPPTLPPPPPPPPATSTPVPAPAEPGTPAEPETPAEPTPEPTPASNYRFNVAVVGRCDPQEAGNWFDGKTYINGEPKSGYMVAFSYAPDGPAVASIQSGPHEGYTNWDAGYYSHIINSAGAKAGSWFVWVEENGQRISEIANFSTDGPGGSCNQAVVDFDSRP